LNPHLPFLEVRGPEGQESTVEITKERLTIGRFRDFNDLPLEDDPQMLVTRIHHCIVQRDMNGWSLIDNASVNKTFRRRGQSIEMVVGRLPLAEGDVIRILGMLTETGESAYWELTFHDPERTRPVVDAPRAAHLEYDWIQAKLFRIDAGEREEIRALSPQQHKLIRYMDQRNRSNGNVPVMCAFEELMTAIWGEEPCHTQDELSRLVWGLRQRIELDPKEPRFLQTERGLGYRLET
jgi:hypothetical protein